MSGAELASKADGLRRETADVLFDAAVAVRAGEYEHGATMLEDAAERTECDLCAGTLTAAAAGVAYVASPVGVGRMERADHVADHLVRQAGIIDPDIDELE
jgi:hypothetical protein